MECLWTCNVSSGWNVSWSKEKKRFGKSLLASNVEKTGECVILGHEREGVWVEAMPPSRTRRVCSSRSTLAAAWMNWEGQETSRPQTDRQATKTLQCPYQNGSRHTAWTTCVPHHGPCIPTEHWPQHSRGYLCRRPVGGVHQWHP